MLNIEHSQWVIIVSRMKHYFDSHLCSNSSGPTSEIIRAIPYTQNRQTTEPLKAQPFHYCLWLIITQCQIDIHPLTGP